jgi:thymidylate synthase (FAD)
MVFFNYKRSKRTTLDLDGIETNKMIKVFPPYGFVELESSNGSDLDVVNAAKVSFAKQSDNFGEAEEKILNFLIRERHGSPFEHNYLKFHVRAPIFVVREWERHRIGFSYNEESGRYTELRPHFYIPDIARTQKGKPGSYFFELGDNDQTEIVRTAVKMHSKQAFKYYQELLDAGVAKEQARIVLPLNTYTEFYFSCNARSLMNFLELRMAPNAMYEIRKYAEALYELWAKVMPATAKAFEHNGFTAP